MKILIIKFFFFTIFDLDEKLVFSIFIKGSTYISILTIMHNFLGRKLG